MDKEASPNEPWYLPLRKLLKKTHGDSSGTKHSTPQVNSQDGIFDPDTAPRDPHAKEKRMPKWLVRVLKDGDKVTTVQVRAVDGAQGAVEVRAVETPGLISFLSELSKVDATVRRAVYCSPKVHYVAKTRREGSFCGYRNIQMMVSYVYNAKLLAQENSGKVHLPSIFMLQDMIENAWDKGFNSSARDDLGPLRMTRKFIGTSEAEALFLSMGLPVSTKSFVSTSKVTAFSLLLEYVSTYFGFGGKSSTNAKAVICEKPPLYLQRPGHSLTIVGITEDVQEIRALMVFDPKYPPVEALRKMAQEGIAPARPAKVLKRYQYGSSELAGFDAFEVLQLDSHTMNSKGSVSDT